MHSTPLNSTTSARSLLHSSIHSPLCFPLHFLTISQLLEFPFHYCHSTLHFTPHSTPLSRPLRSSLATPTLHLNPLLTSHPLSTRPPFHFQSRFPVSLHPPTLHSPRHSALHSPAHAPLHFLLCTPPFQSTPFHFMGTPVKKLRGG